MVEPIVCDNDISYLIVQLAKAHRNKANDILRDIKLDNGEHLHAGQEFTLSTLYQHNGLTISELAEKLDVTMATTSKIIKRLKSNGLIEKRKDNDDGRIQRIHLTEKGRNLKPDVEAAWKRLDKRTTEGLTTEEQVKFKQLLEKVVANLQDN